MDRDAEEFRFQVFVSTTEQDARNRIAFADFINTIHSAAECAVMSNMYDGGEHAEREFREMKRSVTDLLFGLLQRVDLGEVVRHAEGVGYAIRYGLVEPRKGGLDLVRTADDLQALAERGYAADQDVTDKRIEELSSRHRGRR